jgi:hypothetical protein
MKKIRIVNITNPDLTSHYIKQKMYSVSLGNGVTKWFSNEKDAKQFLADVNRLLNQVIHELNYIYGNVFLEYRHNWGYFDGTRKQLEKDILRIMQTIDRSFNLAVERAHLTNGNHFAFSHILNIINETEGIILILSELLTERKHYAEVHRLEVYIKMLTVQKIDLNQLGRNTIES